MNKKYIVRLTEEERVALDALVSKGVASAQKIKHANVLLKIDADGPAWADEQAAEVFGCAPRTVFSIRQRCVEQGLEAALERKGVNARPASRCSTVRSKRVWCRSPAVSHRRGAHAGHSTCLPSNWSPWTWWNRFPRRR